MAWQILVMNVAGEAPWVCQPQDHQFEPLGDHDAVRAKVSEYFPEVD